MPFKLFQDIKVATSFTDFIGIICTYIYDGMNRLYL